MGFNYRMEGMQGAILRIKVRYIERWTELRRAPSARYHEFLEVCDMRRLQAQPYAGHLYHCYVLRTPKRDRLFRALHAQEIHAGIHYPIPVHLQEAWLELGDDEGDFPHSEAAANEVLSRPLVPELMNEQIEQVVTGVQIAMSPTSVSGIAGSIRKELSSGILFAENLAQGWASMTVVLMLGLQRLMMGVLRAHLWRAFDEAGRRPMFLMEDRTPNVVQSASLPRGGLPFFLESQPTLE